MDQFVVPQFIDIEDKIFGPITTRQFLILLSTAFLLFIIYRLADFTLFVILAVVLGILSCVVSFVKINGQTFHYFLLNIGQTLRKPGLRVWNKTYTNKDLLLLIKQEKEEIKEVVPVRRVRREHIRELALLVNTGGYYQPTEEEKE